MESFHSQETVTDSNLEPIRPVKVRCPECLKLYSVNPTEITEAKPRFQCVTCHTRFWMAYPECLELSEVVGQVDEESLVSQTTSRVTTHCPACQKECDGGTKECPSCGVVFEKYEKRMALLNDDFAASSRLKALWQDVLEDYESELKHQTFLRACQKENNLPYASSRYRALLDIQSGDELAQKMQNEIVALSSIHAMRPDQDREKFKPMRPSKRLPFRFSTIIIFLSSMIIAFGYFFPLFRNMVGVGASILFFTLAVRFYLRQVS